MTQVSTLESVVRDRLDEMADENLYLTPADLEEWREDLDHGYLIAVTTDELGPTSPLQPGRMPSTGSQSV